MNKRALAVSALACALIGFGAERNASAEISLRAGADIKPLVYFGNTSGTIADGGWLGLHVAPGLRLLKILTLELDINPMIPISDKTQAQLLLAPAVLLDLYVAYARLALPIQVTNGAGMWIEAAAGISFLSFGYIGVVVDYSTRIDSTILVGAEIGFRMSF